MRSAPTNSAPASSALAEGLVAALEPFPELKLVVLFGSAAHGRLRRESDVDVAVMADARLPTTALVDITSALERATGRSVDLVDLEGAHGTLLEAILKEGLRLRADRHRLLDLYRRHVFEQTDFMPAYRKVLSERRQGFLRE
jgi:predicted nucleotidyltransferase